MDSETEIILQFLNNIFEETGRDVREDLEIWKDILTFEDDKLVRLGFAGLEVPVVSKRLFKGLDVSNVLHVYIPGSATRIIEEDAFEGFEMLEFIRFTQSKPEEAMEEVHLTEEFRKRVRIDNMYLKSDDELAYSIAQRFAFNYQQEFGVDYSDEINFNSARRGYNGFEVWWGKLVRISMDYLHIPRLSARLFRGIDISNVIKLTFIDADIEIIEDGAFDQFTSLSYLDLTGNKFDRLPKFSDELLSHLYQINVQYNFGYPLDYRPIIEEQKEQFEQYFFKGNINGRLEFGQMSCVWYSPEFSKYFIG